MCVWVGMNVCKYAMERRYICQFSRAWFRLQIKRTHSEERAVRLRPNQILCHWIHLCTACRDSNLHYGKHHHSLSFSFFFFSLLFDSLLMFTEPLRSHCSCSQCFFFFIKFSFCSYLSFGVVINTSSSLRHCLR